MGFGIKSFSTPELHGLFAGVHAPRLKLPTQEGEPGEWCEAGGNITVCRNGWHDSSTFRSLIEGGFLGPLLAIVEHDGECQADNDGNKQAHRRMRYVRDLGWTPELCVDYCKYCAELADQIKKDQEAARPALNGEDPVRLLAFWVWEKCGKPEEVSAL